MSNTTRWHRINKDLFGIDVVEKKSFPKDQPPNPSEGWIAGYYKKKYNYISNPIVGYVIPTKILSDMMRIDWELLYSKDFSDMNEKKFLFFKKDLVVNHIAKHCGNSSIVYVGHNDADFKLTKTNTTIECKTNLSRNMYKKNGTLKDSVKFTLMSSNGTNEYKFPDITYMSDIYLIVMKDGVFATTRETVWSSSIPHGDGFRAEIDSKYLTEITGKMDVEQGIKVRVKDRIKQILQDAV